MDRSRATVIVTLLGGIAAALAAAAAPPSPPSPPVAPVRDVVDDYFGTGVHDPYRWMEQGGADFADWLQSQGAFSRDVLDRIPGRAQLLAQLHALDRAADQIGRALHCNEARWLYTKTPADGDIARLYVRDAAASERVLVDPKRFDRGEVRAKITYWSASWDCKHVAYGISLAGSELGTLRVLDVDRGTDLAEVIDDTYYAAVSWLPDGSGFFYRRRAAAAGSSGDLTHVRVYLHKLGADPAAEAPLVGTDVDATVAVPAGRMPWIAVTPDSPFVMLGLNFGLLRDDLLLYVARLDAVDGPRTPWRPVTGAPDHVRAYTVHGDDLYLAVARDAPRVKVVKLNLTQPDMANAVTVIAERRGVIANIDAAADALYVEEIEGGPSRVLRLPWGGGEAQPVPLPPGRDFGDVHYAVMASVPGAALFVQSWTASLSVLRFDAAAGGTVDSGLQAPAPVDFSDIETREVAVTADDGTAIPLSIMVKRGAAPDHSHPTLLEGYGAYGSVRAPSFDGLRRAWFDRGGILAVAHVRGGGEFGDPWHQAGMLANKPNTITDFIACAQYLIEQGYTSPQRLAAAGGSAGGILVGGAITRRPDLFAAALVNVGVLDTLRFEEIPIGPFNTSEFGSVKTPDGFKMLMAVDAYQQVRDGVRYPAVLLSTGLNDTRVSPWQSGKIAARLQAASASGKPILLRIDAEAGHLGGTRAQGEAMRADQYAFLLWQMGVAGFQPSPAP